jgi:phosphoadenosine phosphosulfate reductase
MSYTAEQISRWNTELRARPALDIVRWAASLAPGRAIVSTNFRPYEAVILHLATQARPGIPVLWVDHGYNLAATYRHAEEVTALLKLNLKPYLPRLTPAHRDAVHGPVPSPDDETGLKRFSALMKLEPFQRGMRELAPAVWITALRRSQTANRAALDTVTWDANFNTLKVSPLLDWEDEQLDAYLREHRLPNELAYFDPAKADAKRECGLHVAWGREAVAGVDAAR